MIRLYRPDQIPATLTNRGQIETELLYSQYDANRADYDSGGARFPTADTKIYGSAVVRRGLRIFHHNKCCYSETKFIRDYVPVEHFRPKAAIGQQGSPDKQYPGYYWLAYAWSNLLLCKPGINSNKKDYFPLNNDDDRVINHHGDLSLESPMFIDPASENPRDHIRFHNDEPYAYDSSNRGQFTIDMLLLHPDLAEARLTCCDKLLSLKMALKLLGDSDDKEKRVCADGIRIILDAATQPDAEFSSMAIDLLS